MADHSEGLPPIVTEDEDYLHVEINGNAQRISLKGLFQSEDTNTDA